MVLYGVAAYNLLQNLLFNFGYLNVGDLLDTDTMVFYEYTWKMITIRTVFFIALFLLSIPNLLKRKMESM